MVEESSGADRPLRADAEERRQRILHAAMTVFAAEGLDVPMDRIARAAGVGVGTLYRRFPDRTSLVLGVMTFGVTVMIEDVRAGLDGDGSAWSVLQTLVSHPVQTLSIRPQVMADPALFEAARQDEPLQNLQRRMLDLLADLVAQAQAEGAMRSDVGPGDVALLLGMMGRRPLLPGPQATRNTARVQALVLDALAASDRHTLPGPPLGLDDLRPPS